MRPRFYHWRHMIRDYSRLLLDDKWYWCRHCCRPVEHVMASPAEQSGLHVLTCLDCGFVDPDFAQTQSDHRSQTEHG